MIKQVGLKDFAGPDSKLTSEEVDDIRYSYALRDCAFSSRRNNLSKPIYLRHTPLQLSVMEGREAPEMMCRTAFRMLQEVLAKHPYYREGRPYLALQELEVIYYSDAHSQRCFEKGLLHYFDDSGWCKRS
jgi:hypothetical protein